MPLHNRRIGDTLIPLKVQLLRPNDSTVVDLTGLTVDFIMFDTDGVEKVSQTPADILDNANGQVQYDFDSYDVDTAGDFYAYFIVVGSGEEEHFPVIPKTLIVRITEDVL